MIQRACTAAQAPEHEALSGGVGAAAAAGRGALQHALQIGRGICAHAADGLQHLSAGALPPPLFAGLRLLAWRMGGVGGEWGQRRGLVRMLLQLLQHTQRLLWEHTPLLEGLTLLLGAPAAAPAA
eukprot:363782-Pelagomonas_calceolata.AAC.1